eukprot:TRINITY_DN20533_c0_g2_i1.p1 TRINITY_DN20533_c0_g2~~TRINITY_DN20533_c0_g2_i1.p1  ORF type:complete len:241 (-),score=14.13 TRINITY_DN20533_c0_g2_i1:155-805(-)
MELGVRAPTAFIRRAASTSKHARRHDDLNSACEVLAHVSTSLQERRSKAIGSCGRLIGDTRSCTRTSSSPSSTLRFALKGGNNVTFIDACAPRSALSIDSSFGQLSRPATPTVPSSRQFASARNLTNSCIPLVRTLSEGGLRSPYGAAKKDDGPVNTIGARARIAARARLEAWRLSRCIRSEGDEQDVCNQRNPTEAHLGEEVVTKAHACFDSWSQ